MKLRTMGKRNNEYINWGGLMGKVALIVIGILVAIGVIILIATGFGFFYTILLLFLLGLTIFFGMMGELIGATIISALFHIMSGPIIKLLNIWFSSPKVNETLNFFLIQGFFRTIVIIFFFVVLLSFITGSVKLFRVNFTSSSNQTSD